MARLTAADIRHALEVLSRDLEEHHVRAELLLVGGAAKGFIQGYAEGETLLECNSLRVRTLATRQLLAMKLAAWRDDVDIDDARLLLSSLPGTREEVWTVVEPFILPGRHLKARYAFDDLWESSRGSA